MAITAEFQTGIAHLVGRRSMVCEAGDAISVEALLRTLAAADPQVGAALLEADGTLELSLLIAIGARVIPRSLWASATVADGSTVEVHVAFIGG